MAGRRAHDCGVGAVLGQLSKVPMVRGDAVAVCERVKPPGVGVDKHGELDTGVTREHREIETARDRAAPDQGNPNLSTHARTG